MLLRSPTRRHLHVQRSAFTLLEILIVVAIIVMLAGTGTYYLMQNYEEAKMKTAKTSVMGLAQQLEIYKLNNDQYPASLEGLAQQQPNGSPQLVPPEQLRDPWGNPYQMDATGPNNHGMKADVFTKAPSGKTIGNWPDK